MLYNGITYDLLNDTDKIIAFEAIDDTMTITQTLGEDSLIQEFDLSGLEFESG